MSGGMVKVICLRICLPSVLVFAYPVRLRVAKHYISPTVRVPLTTHPKQGEIA